MSEAECRDQGCCWQQRNNAPWCFHDAQAPTTMTGCAASYGAAVGDPSCCGQPGPISDASHVCGADAPICTGYVYNQQWGTCGHPAPTMPPTLAPTAAPTQVTGYHNLGGDCGGNNLLGGVTNDQTPEQCAQNCDASTDCAGFSISNQGSNLGGSHVPSGTCILKSASCSNPPPGDGFWIFYEKVDYTFVHNGHCGAGWIDGANTRESSIGECASQCRSNSACAYFSYNAVCVDCALTDGMNCALYNAAAGCPDDNQYPDHNSYRMTVQTAAPVPAMPPTQAPTMPPTAAPTQAAQVSVVQPSAYCWNQ